MRAPRDELTVTVLFTDLVGSTAMRSALGDVRADELRAEHDDLITRLVENAEGWVVKGLGDGIMAAFWAPSRALAAAVEIQARLARRNRSVREAERIGVRIGLSVGEVRVEGDDLFGTPVVESARLCSAADGGEILASRLVLRLAGSRTDVAVDDRGALELKGLAEPLPTVAVRWDEGGAGERVPPPSPPGLLDLPFVGRRLELVAVSGAQLESRRGQRKVGLITGEAGLGKSRLVAELARKVHGESGLVLYGRCEEQIGYAYQPFAEALRQYVAAVPDRELRERLGEHAAALGPLAPDLRLGTRLGLPELPELPFELARARFVRAVTGWLAAASAESALVLVIDAAQWGTPPTFDLVRAVLDDPATARLFVVIAYRASQVTPEHPLTVVLDGLRQARSVVERVDMAPLDVAEAARLADGVLGDELGELGRWLAGALVHRGVTAPYLVAENVRLAHQRGAVVPGSGGWVATIAGVDELPVLGSAGAVAGWLLDALSQGVRRVAAEAAVLGLEFDERLLRAVSASPDEVGAALADAVAARVLVAVDGPFPRYAFSSPAARAVLYDELSPGDRLAVHGRAAQVIASGAGTRTRRELAELARHSAIAATGGLGTATPQAAVLHAEAAARRALEQYAAVDAVTWLRRALDLGTRTGALNEPRRAELLLELGAAERFAHLSTATAVLAEAGAVAAQLGDVERLTQAALGVTRDPVSQARRPDPVVHDLLAQAVDRSGTLHPLERAQLLAALAAESVWHPDGSQRFAWIDEALSVARANGEQSVLGQVLLWRSVAIAAPDTVGERLELASELERVAAAAGDDVLRVHAGVQLARLAREVGDSVRAGEALAHADEVASQLPVAEARWLVALERVARDHLVGDLAAAERASAEARELGRAAAHPEAEALHAATSAALRDLQGRAHELAPVLATAPSEEGRDGYGLLVALHRAGAVDRAWEGYSAVRALGFEVPRSPVTGLALTNLAELAVRFADVGGATLLADRLASWADITFCGVVHQQVTAHHLGRLAALVGNVEEGRAWLRRAVEREDRMGAPLLAARSRLALAELEVDARTVEPATVALVDEAAEAAQRHGAAGIEAEVAALRARLG